jgi:hypothetical protein
VRDDALEGLIPETVGCHREDGPSDKVVVCGWDDGQEPE